MSQTIVRYDKFSPSEENVKLGEVRPNKNGQGKNVRLTYNGNSLYLSSQKLRNPFGFSRGKEGTQQYNKKFTCTLSFDLESPKGRDFKDAMQALENMVAEEAYEKRVEWGLGKTRKEARDKTKDEVRRMMTPIVKYALDKETEEVISDYPPTFRVTFNTRNNEETGEVEAITSEVYDQDGNRMRDVDENSIRPNSSAKVLMYANSVWVTPTGYGVNFRIRQIKVYPGDGLPTGKCLLPNDSDDEDEGDSRPVTSGGVNDESGDESEAEGDGGEEEESRPKKLSLKK